MQLQPDVMFLDLDLRQLLLQSLLLLLHHPSGLEVRQHRVRRRRRVQISEHFVHIRAANTNILYLRLEEGDVVGSGLRCRRLWQRFMRTCSRG